jgi:hypothetical protein
MRNYFTNDCLTISVERRKEENKLILHIGSDYSGGCHKSQLHVNEKRLAEKLEELWKSIKTKKLLKLSAYFNELDYYDNEVDVYTTPIARIERGLKRARLFESTHGAIPKDWEFIVTSVFADTSTNTPIIEVIKRTLGSLFTLNLEKEFVKKLRPVLQKKTNYMSFSKEYED